MTDTPWWHWPANRHETYAPWWEILRRCLMAVPFYVLVIALTVVMVLGWGVQPAMRFWKDMT